MTTGPSDEELRGAARHRGFRLVKSRVKTPGKADHGKYGLIDAKGAAVFGHAGAVGGRLTASAAEIATYLRTGSVSTWAASVGSASEAPAKPRRARSVEPEADVPLVIRPRKRSRSPPTDRPDSPEPAPRLAVRRAAAREAAVEVESAPEPAVPTLRIRRASRADAQAVAELVELAGGDADRERIANMCGKRGADILVADQGGVVGVIAWLLLPSLQRGLIGRISLLVVAEEARRAGIGRALLTKAEAQLVRAGAALVEIVSDIEVRNGHRFLRELGFEQTSYRFARAPSA